MKRAKVSELQARLSAYLADVRGGDTVIVYDRNTPIARLVPYDDDAEGFTVNERRSRPGGPRLTLARLARTERRPHDERARGAGEEDAR